MSTTWRGWSPTLTTMWGLSPGTRQVWVTPAISSTCTPTVWTPTPGWGPSAAVRIRGAVRGPSSPSWQLSPCWGDAKAGQCDLRPRVKRTLRVRPLGRSQYRNRNQIMEFSILSGWQDQRLISLLLSFNINIYHLIYKSERIILFHLIFNEYFDWQLKVRKFIL